MIYKRKFELSKIATEYSTLLELGFRGRVESLAKLVVLSEQTGLTERQAKETLASLLEGLHTAVSILSSSSKSAKKILSEFLAEKVVNEIFSSVQIKGKKEPFSYLTEKKLMPIFKYLFDHTLLEVYSPDSVSVPDDVTFIEKNLKSLITELSQAFISPVLEAEGKLGDTRIILEAVERFLKTNSRIEKILTNNRVRFRILFEQGITSGSFAKVEQLIPAKPIQGTVWRFHPGTEIEFFRPFREQEGGGEVKEIPDEAKKSITPTEETPAEATSEEEPAVSEAEPVETEVETETKPEEPEVEAQVPEEVQSQLKALEAERTKIQGEIVNLVQKLKDLSQKIGTLKEKIPEGASASLESEKVAAETNELAKAVEELKKEIEESIKIDKLHKKLFEQEAEAIPEEATPEPEPAAEPEFGGLDIGGGLDFGGGGELGLGTEGGGTLKVERQPIAADKFPLTDRVNRIAENLDNVSKLHDLFSRSLPYAKSGEFENVTFILRNLDAGIEILKKLAEKEIQKQPFTEEDEASLIKIEAFVKVVEPLVTENVVSGIDAQRMHEVKSYALN